MFELLVMGSFVWWLYLIAFFGLITAFIENKSGIGAFVTLILGFSILDLVGNTPILHTIINEPYKILIFALAYVPVGVVWGLIKWRLFIGKKHAEYVKIKDEYCLKMNITGPFTDEQKVAFKKHLIDRHDYNEDKDGNVIIRPLARLNKSLITMWMSFWPQSMFWTLTHDLILNIFETLKSTFNYIREKLTYYLEAMSVKRFKDSENELK